MPTNHIDLRIPKEISRQRPDGTEMLRHLGGEEPVQAAASCTAGIGIAQKGDKFIHSK